MLPFASLVIAINRCEISMPMFFSYLPITIPYRYVSRCRVYSTNCMAGMLLCDVTATWKLRQPVQLSVCLSVWYISFFCILFSGGYRGASGHVPLPPLNSWPSEEKLWELLSSWLSVSTMAMLKFVADSPPEKIMFSAIFYRNSSAFDWATLSLEYHMRLDRRTGGLDLDILLQCKSKHSDGPEKTPK